MALALNKFRIKLSVEALKTNTLDIGGSKDEFNWSKVYGFVNGSGAVQAHEFWTDSRNLAATTADNHDLAASLVSSTGLGSTITFTKIKAIIIVHKTPAASAALSVGGHATLALATMFTSTVDLDTDQPALQVPPGGMLALVAGDAAGYAVTATTEDMLRVYNGAAAAIDYDIILLGCTS